MVEQLGEGGLPDTPPVVVRDAVQGAGESVVQEWPLAPPTEALVRYEALKAAMATTPRLAQVTLRTAHGRATLVERYVLSGEGTDDGETVEELYAEDVIVPVYEAPYFAGITNDRMAFVLLCAENRCASESQINALQARLDYHTGMMYQFWTTQMKHLLWHLIRGRAEMLKTQFVLRRSEYGVRTRQVQAAFANINRVVPAPALKTDMSKLLSTLPPGEWLYRPPQAEYLGKGRWRVKQEWSWAEQWSVLYGGSWTGEDSA